MFDQIYLTGFQKFGDHDVNPTEMIADHFASANIPGLTSSILEVTVEAVDLYINKIKDAIVTQNNKRILNLHFGVGPNTVYNWQTCGYNKKDFGIPDNNGNKFTNEKICVGKDLDCQIKCSADFHEVFLKLKGEFEISESVNPGRYLCNYIYFRSLNDLSSLNNTCSLFIHFPAHAYKSHEQNIKFVESLLGLCLKKQ